MLETIRAGLHWLDWPYFSVRLNALELRLLAELGKVLPPQAREILSKQVEGINRVHRSRPDGKEVNCYRKPSWDDIPKFPSGAQDVKAITIRFKVPGVGSWRADLDIVAGHFFSITFDRSPKSITNRGADVVIESVRIHDDPMAPPAGEPEREALRPFSGWLKALSERHEIREPSPPLASTERERRLSRLTAKLPVDYPELVSQTDGLVVGNCSVLGLAELHDVVLPDANYYMLGDVHGQGALGVRQDSRDAAVYFLPYEGEKPRPIGDSLRDALEALLPAAMAKA